MIAVPACAVRTVSLGTRFIRVLTALHRYVGTALCIVFAAWFASGLVMMYAGYPQLSEADKLARMRPLDWSAARLLPGDAVRAAGAPSVDYVRLAMLGHRPVYLLHGVGGGWLAVGADDGAVLRELDVQQATAVALEFAPTVPALEYRGRLDSPDQWTIISAWAPYLAEYSPVPSHKFSLGDSAGTELYVLAATGDVVQEISRGERVLGYLGAVVHWIYPTRLRVGHLEGWIDLVVWLSAIGALLCLAGIVIGVTTYRWRREPGVAGSPFRGWLKWHHYTGLLFGLLATTWVFSGLMSMDPWNWSVTDDNPDGSHAEIMRGGALDAAAFVVEPAAALAACNAELATRELRLVQLAGEPYYWCVEAPDRTLLVSGRSEGESPVAMLAAERLTAAARAIVPQAELGASELLTEYDAYYYPGWHDKVINRGSKRLPILRLTFADAGRTLVYVDPYSAAPVLAYDTSGRWYRWLFHGLHSFDFGAFYRARPLWDVVTLALMLAGLVLSVTGVWVGVKWLGRKLRAVRRSPLAAKSS